MSDKIFDLEQQIMQCWHVVDDIDMLYKYFGDDPKFVGLDATAEDEMMNLLLGLKSLYQLKFEQMFKTFEGVCKEYHQIKNDRESLKWPEDDDRIDNIGQNGNDGLHYTEDAMKSLGDDPGFDWVEHEAKERADKQARRAGDENV